MHVTEVIKAFLKFRQLPANADLVARWTPAMETQVNVAAGNGEPVDGRRSTYSDGVNEWWNIRIPKNADGRDDKPPFWNDYDLKFPFELHAEGIGCTGFDWENLRSRWVAFDFDSLTAHALGVGITDEELEKVKLAAEALPYVETRKSTGGGGIHLYVYFDAAGIPTANHTEHAALARCILGMMSSDTNFDFASAIDCCGGIMWIWATKMTTENGGLSLIKPATKELSLADLPSNWRDHIEVVQKKRSKVRVNGVEEDDLSNFDNLTSSRMRVPLDASHKGQIEALMRSGFTTLWISDQHLLQTHTCALTSIMETEASELGLVGIFQTSSGGKDRGSPNCFLFPLPKGAWKVYRFSPGISESETWDQDKNGWTTCVFNRLPDLATAAKAHSGEEDPDKLGQFIFDTATDAMEAAEALGQKVDIAKDLQDRTTRLKAVKDGRLAVEIAKEKGDKKPKGWIDKKDRWVRVFEAKTDSEDSDDDQGAGDHDGILRELVAPNKKTAGWVVRKGEEWIYESPANVDLFLLGMNIPPEDVRKIMGKAVVSSWQLVDLPFQPEYPGGRQWNLDAAQLIYQPAILGDEEAPKHPHWDKVLNHIGQDLNAALRSAPRAQKAGIKTGAQYLLAWIASMIRFPFSPLPYLFLFGPENSGKSIFHESINLLMTKGCVKADRALTSTSDFNGELANCILAIVEEKDISKCKGALNKIKEWVTARYISIRQMRMDSYEKINTTHWVQCANKRDNCPIFPGDSRITAIHVPDLLEDQEIPKEKLIELLKDEAPHFMHSLMNLALPEPTGRLRIPIVETAGKKNAQSLNRSSFPWADQWIDIVDPETRPLPDADKMCEKYEADTGKADTGRTEAEKAEAVRRFGRLLTQWAQEKGCKIKSDNGPTGDGGRTRCWFGGIQLRTVPLVTRNVVEE